MVSFLDIIQNGHLPDTSHVLLLEPNHLVIKIRTGYGNMIMTKEFNTIRHQNNE